MVIRNTGIIFAILLLVSSVVSAQTHSDEWRLEKDQSWARTRIDFPASAIAGPFQNRMVEIDKWSKQNNTSLYNNSNKPYLLAQMVQREVDEQKASKEREESWARAKIDYPASAVSEPFRKRIVELNAWAKQNNPSLYNNSNRPYLIAQMVQREVDEASARQTVPSAPPKMQAPTARPTVSSPAPQPSLSAAVEEIVQSHKPNPDRPAIWLGAAIIVALTSAVAFLFFKIVSPKHGVKTAVALGRRWAAWTGFFATFSVMPKFFFKFDANSLAIWIIAIGFYTPAAFVIGWIIGLFRYRKSKIELHQENPPGIVGVKDLKSPRKTVRLTTVKPPPTTVLLTTAKLPPAPIAQPPPSTFMKNTEYDVTVPEGIELENGYVEMRHNTQYSLILKNYRAIRCDAKVLIDGTHVGTWRIEKNGEIRIERPVHDTGHFTFFTVGTEEARIAGIAKSSENGLISVTFTPEKIRDPHTLYAGELPDCSQGATGLTGESKQRFVNADNIDYDTTRSFTIHLRLVSARPDIRPLAQRSTPIPPPID